MSHEIRTPLNAIIGLAYLLMQAKLAPREMEYVNRIEGAGKLLLAIVNDILDFSKIDAGQMQLDAHPFQLDEVLDNLSNLVRARIQEKKLILQYIVAADTPQNLIGDSLRLSQVLINLVSNAIKFTSEGAITIRVSAGPCQHGRAEFSFEIHDTGIGMSEDQLARLFQPFSQADSSVTRKYGGTGLGLIICQRIVQMMDGDISVTSQPQQGSTFAFRIQLGVLDDSPPSGIGANDHVLVVDDNELARRVLSSLLGQQGCTVSTAESGDAALLALHAARDTPFDCVMIDLHMPGMDGIHLARHIRAEQQSPCHLVLVTSENIHGSDYGQSLHDFDAIIEKPVTAARISEVITQLKTRPAVASPITTNSPQAAPLAGLHLMVAEDVPTNQLIMRDLLESLGATVDIAENGQLAIQHLQVAGDRIAMILMDIQMPELDGLAATRRIREGAIRADIPIIALTAHALEDERQRAIAAGMNDFVTKPIEPAQLIAVIQRWRPVTSSQPPSVPQVMLTSGATPAETTELPGINVSEGLRRVLNRRPIYNKILNDFQARFSGEAQRIRDALAAGDTADAALRAHSLKGTGAMIGATILANFAAELEQAIKQGRPDTREHLERLELELHRVLSGIQATDLSNPDPPSSTAQ